MIYYTILILSINRQSKYLQTAAQGKVLQNKNLNNRIRIVILDLDVDASKDTALPKYL